MFEMAEKMKIARRKVGAVGGAGPQLPSQKRPIKLGSELQCEALHCHGIAKFPLSACRVFCFESLCVAFAGFGSRLPHLWWLPRCMKSTNKTPCLSQNTDAMILRTLPSNMAVSP
ncbi:hypothetical protein AVEN_11402-1 [Araneus ventricosus]|uniref:Uncharacterized protein n=1 Tax=Araneus ventricosus TaxID=182803 RepID=A0A4Y2IRS4_ARAVE|nr:hypothetical protein AVEN_11402-1 [Araneus ventricosus]